MGNLEELGPSLEEIHRAAKLRQQLCEHARTLCPDLYVHLASLELLHERAGIYLGQDYDDDLSDLDYRPF